jgi:hypothetical protein
MHKLSLAASGAPAVFVMAMVCASVANAQSSCSSDGVPRPTALLERFINADCDNCWADKQTPDAAAGTLAIDWVVPGSRGDDAPLSAVAVRDGLMRLQAAGRSVPAASDTAFSRAALPQSLRVAHGLPFNDYIGTSIELRRPTAGARWTAWLLLVESLPRGTEGSPVERSLVRNALRVEWKAGGAMPLLERRSMRVPEGSRPERLRVVGWIEDARGRVASIAQSRCQGG